MILGLTQETNLPFLTLGEFKKKLKLPADNLLLLKVQSQGGGGLQKTKTLRFSTVLKRYSKYVKKVCSIKRYSTKSCQLKVSKDYRTRESRDSRIVRRLTEEFSYRIGHSHCLQGSKMQARDWILNIHVAGTLKSRHSVLNNRPTVTRDILILKTL